MFPAGMGMTLTPEGQWARAARPGAGLEDDRPDPGEWPVGKR